MGSLNDAKGERAIITSVHASARMSDAQRHRLLVEWNDTRAEYPRDRCVHEIFAAQAEETPDAIAVTSADEKLTYRELDRRSDQLAHHLRAQRVGPEVVVGLCAGRSPEMIVALLAILKAGGAYLPLDPSYPQERLEFMLENAGAKLVLTHGGDAGSRLHANAQVMRLEEMHQIAKQPQTTPVSGGSSDNLAYVMYTSGSTGKPKAVAVVHYNISRLVKGANYVDITARDVFLQLAPLSFDASTFEIWGALLNGANLVLYPDGLVDLARLKTIIADNGVSILWLTAGLFNRIVDEDISALAPVKQLLAGGDALSVAHVKKVLDRLFSCQVINGYGPTECTTFSVCFRVPGASAIETSVPIGRPVSNAQAYVLDSELKLVPIGTVGELFIGGDGLARGYFNFPDLTAERFISNPFGAAGTRLYRTGDRVRHLPDGNLEFLGRIDRQMKVRGYRIEPGEIEAMLLTHPGLRQTVVIASEDALGDKRLIAYLTGDSGNVPETAELRVYLKTKLPDYMIPSAFVVLDELPLTPNGKIDRVALPPPEWRSIRNVKRALPRTPIEKAVAQIWSDALETSEVGIHDDFASLGGTPQQFAHALAKIHERFSVPTMTVEIGNATVASLVNYIRTKLKHPGDSEAKVQRDWRANFGG